MLGADLVRARRRGDMLSVSELSSADRMAALSYAEELLLLCRESVGSSLDEVNELLSAVEHPPKHGKLVAGLTKLVLDACEFGQELPLEPAALRKLVFEKASAQRMQLGPADTWQRQQLLLEVAQELQVGPELIEQALFSDLKGAAKLGQAPKVRAEHLVDGYDLAQLQGVLARAVRLSARVRCSSPLAFRALFFKLKFRQLLYRLLPLGGGEYELEIEGPFSLFESVTKYGVQFSMILPALLACDSGSLRAELRWGKERKTLFFEKKWKESSKAEDASGAQPLRSDVAQLLQALEKKSSEWTVRVNDDLLDIPGVGLVIPDLKFERPNAQPVYLEVLGFWSRDAVWKRIEWAQAGGGKKVVFAASSRLRVSPEVLDESSGASLYVYKGTLNPKAVLDHVSQLSPG